jgi:hypothetical protein
MNLMKTLSNGIHNLNDTQGDPKVSVNSLTKSSVLPTKGQEIIRTPNEEMAWISFA